MLFSMLVSGTLLEKFAKIPILTLMILVLAHTNLYARPLQLCTHLGFEPYVIEEKGSLSGIDIDIILKILNELKQPAEIKAYPWKRLIASIREGTCDMGFSLFDTDDRREFAEFIFTVPMHYSTFSVFVKRNSDLKFNRISDFFGLRVAHNRGFALSVGFEQAIADGRIKRVMFDDTDSAMRMLQSGRIDAILDNEARFRYYLKKADKLSLIKSLNIPFMPHHPAFLAVSRKSDFENIAKIKKSFEKSLKKLHLNGSILAITTKYIN